MLILPDKWEHSDSLKERIIHHMKRKDSRKAYYPGAKERYQQFLDRYDDAIICGEGSDDVVPWTILPNVPAQADEYALTVEAFCGVLAITHIDASNPNDYLNKVVPFCNDNVWGTLSANIIIHHSTQKNHKAAYEKALEDLRYGGIGVNCWSGLVYGLGSPTWGAYPGHILEDITSGRGTVHNTFLLDHPEKSIVYAPFRISPTPAWFFDNQNLIALGKALVDFEAKPSWFGLLSIIPKAFKG